MGTGVVGAHSEFASPDCCARYFLTRRVARRLCPVLLSLPSALLSSSCQQQDPFRASGVLFRESLPSGREPSAVPASICHEIVKRGRGGSGFSFKPGQPICV